MNCIQQQVQPLIFGDGLQTRDFVFVTDIVRACRAAMVVTEKLGGEAFNIGSGKSVSLLELWEALKELTGPDLVPKHHPARAGDIRHPVADVMKAADLLHFRAEVSLQNGLQKIAF